MGDHATPLSAHQLRTLALRGRGPIHSLLFRRGSLLISVTLACFALSRPAQATIPETTDTVLLGGNTADGQLALSSLTTGAFNSAFGFFSLLVNTDASFNTGAGAGTLLLNNANENTAVGAGALLTNSDGANNTAFGTFVLFSNTLGKFNNAIGARSLRFNVDGDSNNALGESALFSNIHGVANTAIGDAALANNDSSSAGLGRLNTAVGADALFSNVDGSSNNAVGFNAMGANVDGSFNNVVGFDAMADNVSGSGNVAVGDSAGAGVEGDSNIYIGVFAGPAPSAASVAESETIRIGDGFNRACFIGGISGVPVSGDLVAVDENGQLGVALAGSLLSANELLKQQRLVQELKGTTERQAAVIVLMEAQIKALNAGLKQQADQIQKVSAQLEMIRPTPRVVETR